MALSVSLLYSAWWERFLVASGPQGSTLQLIGGPYGLCSAFANDHARSHRIARCDARHDRSVGDTQVFDSINLELGVHDRQGVTSHLSGTGLMPPADRSIAKIVFQCRPLYISSNTL